MRTVPPFPVAAREQVLSWEEKVPTSDWLGGLQTTPRKTLKSFVNCVFAGISIISISISPAHKRRETNLWQHKRKHGSCGDEEVSAFY